MRTGFSILAMIASTITSADRGIETVAPLMRRSRWRNQWLVIAGTQVMGRYPETTLALRVADLQSSQCSLAARGCLAAGLAQRNIRGPYSRRTLGTSISVFVQATAESGT